MSKIKLNELKGIVSSICIDHSDFTMIRSEVERAYEDVDPEGYPVCLLVVGDSRTGKSFMVKNALRNCCSQMQDEQSVVYAVAPAKATLKSLLESLLHGLGDPHWYRGDISNMTQRLYTQLEAVNCRMIILDEFQHLCDKGQDKTLDILADWLKDLIEIKHVGLIAVGMPESQSIINRNPQLGGRFDAVLRMPTFDWMDGASRAQFRGILKSFRVEMDPFELPLIEYEEMAFRMYLATAGRIGLVAKLLNRAVKDAVRRGSRKIDVPALQAAYQRAIWSAPRFPVKEGPFLAKYDALCDEAVVKEAIEHAKAEQVADTSGDVELHGRAGQQGSTGCADEGEASGRGGRRSSKKNGPNRRRRSRGYAKAELGKAL